MLTFAALEPEEIFSISELSAATRELPQEGLRDSAQALVRALGGAGEQRADYWVNRVVPYLNTIWPKTLDNISPALAEILGRLCVASQEFFPEAVTLLSGWFEPPDHPNYLVHQLNESKICSLFPGSALNFLDLMIGSGAYPAPSDLGACLESIGIAEPSLKSDSRYERLIAYWRQRGMG